ncbi:tRNA lysidine(34) synthetase TilS [Reinekea sp.]|jgi:tRNA(Ile)-lysidine synthase|uniref:tRNA lysidine(34) synthetase TilS n=1 Tax=Reinekea sp. TaxID=1970455 RepID=UPI003989FF16
MNLNTSVYHFLCDELKQQLTSISVRPVFVGFSGGMDSMLLLKAACDVVGADQVIAIHVNHGLSKNAREWQQFCLQTSQTLGCQFVIESGEVNSEGKGVEAAARAFRYDVFAKQVPADHALLLAHHLDDQIETFFLRMFRGTGLHGLKAMAKQVVRDNYRLLRPWLDFDRKQLLDAAQALELTWVEDESNQDVSFDRNYLRHQVLPQIEARWPKYRDRIQSVVEQLNSTKSSQSSEQFNDALETRLSHDGGLKWVQMSDWSQADKLTLLHGWLTGLLIQVPSKARLQQILDEVIDARVDATPMVRVGNGYVRRHGPALYWVVDGPELGPAPSFELNTQQKWQGVGTVETELLTGSEIGLSSALPDLNWRVRQGGEEIRPQGRSKKRDLKRLLQEYRVKPWLRDRLPLLYSGNTLVAVADIFISADHLAEENISPLIVKWQKS